MLFTGLADEDGERTVFRLGGSLAKGVNDMTHLVTDKARRTVKFLCAVARGVPIMTPDWLKKVRECIIKEYSWYNLAKPKIHHSYLILSL